MNSYISFVHISDSHVDVRLEYRLLGHINPLKSTEKIIEAVNSLPVAPAFIVHTGDVVDVPGEENYRFAADLFSKLKAPVYYVTGNHDLSAGIKSGLTMGSKTEMGSDRARLTYSFERGGERFLVLDGRGSDEIDPQGELTESDLKVLGEAVSDTGSSLSIFVHFPPLPFNSPWIDEGMLLRNGSEFHELVSSAKARIRGVFCGHIHGSTQMVKDGVFYVTAPSTAVQLSSWPTDEDARVTEDYPPGFNFVEIFKDRVLVRQHTV